MKQIKLFKVHNTVEDDSYNKVEDLVNKWLRENPNVKIVSINYQQTVLTDDWGFGNGVETEFHPSICLVYEAND